MSDGHPSLFQPPPSWVASLCERFEAAWKAGARPRIEDYLAPMPPARAAELLRALLAVEVSLRLRDGGAGPGGGAATRPAPGGTTTAPGC